MPARGERAAPKFDQTKPEELSRFFDDLECLFKRAEITSEIEKKQYVLRYVEVGIERIWKAIPEYKNAESTYQAFKDAVLKYYPDATDDYTYSLRDLDLLIEERLRIGISSVNDLNAFHLQFSAIAAWLKEKRNLTDMDQKKAYVRAFRPELLAAINLRLQLTYGYHMTCLIRSDH